MRRDNKDKSIGISKGAIVAYLVYALMVAAGVFFTGLSILHVDIYATDGVLMSWIFIGITIQIWLYLLFKNID